MSEESREVQREWPQDRFAEFLKRSRYRLLKLVETPENLKRIESPDKIDLAASPLDQFYVVPPGEEHRPDMIAYTVYGDPLLWWVILKANNVKDPFNIPANAVLRIPALKSLTGFQGILS